MPLNIAVLTISDTRSLADDKSGATLADRLTAAGHMLAAREIVTDDVDAIRAIVKRWIADAGVDVIITTGGTGFTGRDVTPEAIEPLFEKRMDGFSIAFHMLSHAKIGTSTIQSRATAGVAGATFIFCLPGSPGACRDGWDGILARAARLPHPAVQFRRDHAAARRASAPAEGEGRDGVIESVIRARRRMPRNDEEDQNFNSQVSPTRSTPKLWCGSLPISAKPGALIDAARGDQDALGPQRDRCDSRPRARNGCIRSTSARPTPSPRAVGSTSSRRNLATSSRCPDQEDRADRLAVDLGDPAMLARRHRRL